MSSLPCCFFFCLYGCLVFITIVPLLPTIFFFLCPRPCEYVCRLSVWCIYQCTSHANAKYFICCCFCLFLSPFSLLWFRLTQLAYANYTYYRRCIVAGIQAVYFSLIIDSQCVSYCLCICLVRSNFRNVARPKSEKSKRGNRREKKQQ